MAWALVRLLAGLDPLKIPRVQDIAIDGRVLAFTAGAAVTGVLFGLVPALQSSRTDPQPALKEGGRDSRAAAGWLRRGLVVGEIAASVVLVAAAMLLARSFARLLDVDAGFNPAHVLTLRTSLPTRATDGRVDGERVSGDRPQLREIPGVEAAGAVTGLPLATTRGDWGIVLEGQPVRGHIHLAADWQVVTPGYFEALGTPLAAGRYFTDVDQPDTLRRHRQRDDGEEVLAGPEPDRPASHHGPERSLAHRRRRRGRHASSRPRRAGPARDVPAAHAVPLRRARRAAVPTMTWVLRTSGDPAAAACAARAAIHAVDASLGVSDVATMDQVLADSTSDRRLNMLLFALLGGLALVLAVVGVYGVVAYSVAQRTHEIGVRMAIGARPGDVVRMVLVHGGRLAVAGVAVGSALALAARG